MASDRQSALLSLEPPTLLAAWLLPPSPEASLAGGNPWAEGRVSSGCLSHALGSF